MTLKSKLPPPLQQYFFQLKDYSDVFLAKLLVVTDSTVIIYSVRILVVVLALLMAYVQSPGSKNEISSSKSPQTIQDLPRSIVDQLK
ncbi:MAG: hypothetical protein HC819_03925 [Cyclobacteriaceae bacterium]|nr:hypothetical protein [Cyclobacteriaceae bacterium]